MRISTLLSYAGGFKDAVTEIAELEKAGLNLVWVPEAYSFDAPSAMGYIAARTKTVTIASGILPIYSRTPSLLAMTAAGIDYLSDGRCMLGLGASGPQVIEGFHGVPYVAPVKRMREVIEICRMVWRRERVQYMGSEFQIPVPQDKGTGLGKPLKLINHPVREEIPIAVASLGPLSVAMTAELADAWLPAFYTAEAAQNVWGAALAKGNAKRDPNRAPLEIFAGGMVAIGEGLEPLRDLARPQAALYIGGMAHGQKTSTTTSFQKAATLRKPSSFRTFTWRREKSRGRGHSRRLPSQKFSDWQREFCKGASAGTQSLWCDRPECKSRRKDASGACRSMR